MGGEGLKAHTSGCGLRALGREPSDIVTPQVSLGESPIPLFGDLNQTPGEKVTTQQPVMAEFRKREGASEGH